MKTIKCYEGSITWVKAFGYVAGSFVVMTDLIFANLDTQIDKASEMVLGNLAALIIGGGMVVGGGYSCYQGDIGRGLAQVGVGGLIGIGTALAKSKVIFNVLS